MLYRYGAFVARRARLLLVLSALLMVGAGVLGAGAFSQLRNGGFDDPSSPSSQAEQLIEAQFGGRSNLVLLVTPTSVRDNPDNALRVALETLSVSDKAPERRPDGQVGQPAPKLGF